MVDSNSSIPMGSRTPTPLSYASPPTRLSKFRHSPHPCSAQHDFKVGDKAPLAHQDVRKFPAWYKPYGFNYFSDGYMLLGFGTLALFGYSYLNDIKEQKGRKQRKVFKSELPTHAERVKRQQGFVDRRLAAHDAHFEKFLHPKERASAHH